MLLDTNIILNILSPERYPVSQAMDEELMRAGPHHASTGALWELAIKHDLGKLALPVTMERVPEILERARVRILPVLHEHAFAGVRQRPDTKDPFDRLMLGVCEVENMKLMTLDRALISHPLAWKPK